MEGSNHGGDDDDREEDQEAKQATKRAKTKENSKKSTKVYNAKRKEAISTHHGNIRILFVMAHTEFMPINLFKLGKIFKDMFE